MKAFWVQVIDLDLYFRYLKGLCHSNQFCEKKDELPTFVALALKKGIGYCYINLRINSANEASISCENFVKFGPETPELTELICERLVRHGQKLAYFVKYLRMYRTDFCNLFIV